jgi:hypothetical protein
VVAVALISSLVLAGCRSGAATSPEPPAPETSVAAQVPARTIQTQTVLDQLINAARAGDRAAFTSMVSTRDSAFRPRAQMIFENLRVLPLRTLQLTVRPRFANLRGDRHRELGDASWVQEAVLRWQLPSEAVPAEHTIWLTMLVEGQQTRLAGTTDIPGSGQQSAPLPLWWLEAVRVERTPKVTALVSKAINAPNRWARSADAVTTKIRPSLAGVVRGWSGSLVLEVPGSSEAFEQVLGARGPSVDHTAAVTRAVGPDPATAPVHIVVNPVESSKLTPVGVSVLLAHEATHMATHSVDSPAPAWVVEGLADQVAYTAYPDARRAAAPLVAQVRAGPVPRALPEDDRFHTSEAGVDLAYTEAWLACRYVAEKYSPRQLDQLYRQLDRGSTFDRAARSVLNVSADKFVADWRRYLSSVGS